MVNKSKESGEHTECDLTNKFGTGPKSTICVMFDCQVKIRSFNDVNVIKASYFYLDVMLWMSM